MNNKTVLITGANAGIGKETALALAKQGAQVILLCRNAAKAEEAKQQIIQESGNTLIHTVICDLANLADVKRVAQEIPQKFPRIDVLVNNAGLMLLDKKTTPNGFETTFAVNYLAHVLLTELLLPTLKASAPSRIIHLSSSAHKHARLNLNDLMFAKTPYKGIRAYANSKLASVLYNYHLAKRLQGSGVTSNALDPGMVNTEFGDKVGIPSWMHVFTAVLRPWVKQPAEGALTSIHLASAPALDQVNGTFWAKVKETRSHSRSYDTELQEQLWEKTKTLLKPWLSA